MVSMMGGKGRASSLYLAQKILENFSRKKSRIVKRRNVDKGEMHGPNNYKDTKTLNVVFTGV
jgi:hypothetical protein